MCFYFFLKQLIFKVSLYLPKRQIFNTSLPHTEHVVVKNFNVFNLKGEASLPCKFPVIKIGNKY